MKLFFAIFFLFFTATAVFAELFWQELPAPIVIKDYVINTIAIGNKNFIWALGKNKTDSILFKWNLEKKVWEEFQKSIPHIETIATSSNDILFVFQKQESTAILQAWNGDKWQEMYRIENARIGSLAAVDERHVYAVINEKAYELSGETWRQLGSLEGFREIAVGADGSVFARRFNFQSALKPETASPAFSLELLRWNINEWQKQEIALVEKNTGVMSIAVQNKDIIWIVIREDSAGGKIYTWLPAENKLDLQGARTDLYTITASNDKTIWAINWMPEIIDRKIYTWTDMLEPKKEDLKVLATMPIQPAQQVVITQSVPQPQLTVASPLPSTPVQANISEPSPQSSTVTTLLPPTLVQQAVPEASAQPSTVTSPQPPMLPIQSTTEAILPTPPSSGPLPQQNQAVAPTQEILQPLPSPTNK